MVIDDPIKPFPADVDRDAFGHWLSGFTDGEGCFKLAVSHRKIERFAGASATFQISLRADDRNCLDLIRSYWDCGTISYHVRRDRAQGNPLVAYRVEVASNLRNIIIPHFERYPLRAKKARDFQIWKQGVELIYTVVNRVQRNSPYGYRTKWHPEDREQFALLAAEIRTVREYRPVLM